MTRCTRRCCARAVAALRGVAARAASRWRARRGTAGTDGLLPIPPLTARVTDLTSTLSAAERQALDAKLAGWEAQHRPTSSRC